MAKGKDPAFLFYPGDASEDTQFMNRLERGCYFDLLKAQKKLGSFTIDQVKKVLGNDFKTCWGAIELVLAKDGDNFFIEWVKNSIENRKEHSAKQKKRIQDYWDKKKELELTVESKRYNHGTEMEEPLENEDAIENEIIIKKREKIIFPFETEIFKVEWENWKKYLSEAKKPYHTFSGEQQALQFLGKYDEVTAIEIIKKSIKNEWKNLREPENDTKQPKFTGNNDRQERAKSVDNLEDLSWQVLNGGEPE